MSATNESRRSQFQHYDCNIADTINCGIWVDGWRQASNSFIPGFIAFER